MFYVIDSRVYIIDLPTCTEILGKYLLIRKWIACHGNDLLTIIGMICLTQERYVNNRNDLFKKWTVFLTYEWIEEAATWKDSWSSLKQNQCFFYFIRFVQKFEWFVFLNIFVFPLKIFTSYLRQSRFWVTFVHADNGSLILQRTNNTRRTHNISFSS